MMDVGGRLFRLSGLTRLTAEFEVNRVIFPLNGEMEEYPMTRHSSSAILLVYTYLFLPLQKSFF